MQNDRDNQNRAYDDNARDRDNQRRQLIEYSAIPGPSFDTGRYVTDQDRDRDRGEGIINRHFGDSNTIVRNYSNESRDYSGRGATMGGNADYSRGRDYSDYSRESHFNTNSDRSQPDNHSWHMGGTGSYGDSRQYGRKNFGGSEQAESSPMRTPYERYHGHGKVDRSSDWMRDMEDSRENRRGTANYKHDAGSYAGPNYGSIQTGGRFDNDRAFTSGGISSMGGDYDRDRSRGRQYRDNYDSAGNYIGDYRDQEVTRYGNQDHNSYDSSFTFGRGSSNSGNAYRSPYFGDRNYGRSNYRSGESHRGGRFGSEHDRDRNRGSHYGSSGYNRNWREDRDHSRDSEFRQGRSGRTEYRTHGFNTGNPDYDRGNFRAADYVHNRPGHEDEERGFLDRAGERVRSWFGGDDNDQNRY